VLDVALQTRVDACMVVRALRGSPRPTRVVVRIRLRHFRFFFYLGPAPVHLLKIGVFAELLPFL